VTAQDFEGVGGFGAGSLFEAPSFGVDDAVSDFDAVSDLDVLSEDGFSDFSEDLGFADE
jgi:hypothetical protein